MKKLKQQLKTTLSIDLSESIYKYQWAALVPPGGAAPLPPLFPASAVESGSADELRGGLLPGPWHRDD